MGLLIEKFLVGGFLNITPYRSIHEKDERLGITNPKNGYLCYTNILFICPSSAALFIESMAQEINFLVKLTNDLLILARVDSGATSLVFTKSRLDEIVMSQTSRLSKLASLKRISMQIDFDSFENATEDALSVYCDPDLLGVLFYNLIENAIKYSKDDSKILIKGINEESSISLIVSDEGEGIDEEQIDKVFDRFFRIDGGGNRVQGNGLGLAICKVVADSLQARLWAQNNTEKGASFYFKMMKT